MAENEQDKDAPQEKGADHDEKKPHVCSVCGRASETTICHMCEDKIRGEVLEKKHEVDKAGRTDSGRR